MLDKQTVGGSTHTGKGSVYFPNWTQVLGMFSLAAYTVKI